MYSHHTAQTMTTTYTASPTLTSREALILTFSHPPTGCLHKGYVENCSQPVIIYIRGHITGCMKLYMMNILQLLQSAGSTQGVC